MRSPPRRRARCRSGSGATATGTTAPRWLRDTSLHSSLAARGPAERRVPRARVGARGLEKAEGPSADMTRSRACTTCAVDLDFAGTAARSRCGSETMPQGSAAARRLRGHPRRAYRFCGGDNPRPAERQQRRARRRGVRAVATRRLRHPEEVDRSEHAQSKIAWAGLNYAIEWRRTAGPAEPREDVAPSPNEKIRGRLKDAVEHRWRSYLFIPRMIRARSRASCSRRAGGTSTKTRAVHLTIDALQRGSRGPCSSIARRAARRGGLLSSRARSGSWTRSRGSAGSREARGADGEAARRL